MTLPASLRLIAHASTRAMRTGTFPDDDPLDALGLAEAAALRGRWMGVAGSLVLCSPARCARQTADALGLLHADIDDALRDLDYGNWRGKRLHDLARDLPDELAAWIGSPSASPHRGESFDAAAHRVGTWLAALPRDRDVVAITHAPIVRAAIAHVLRMDREAAARLDVAPLSCTTFVASPGGWTLAATDDVHDTGA
ncbi:histidine phosphatase family protein [Burkholderia sp. BCCIQ04A]|uniref:Histidine phosphatase family protein n=1 Tax=Burkholderia anthinoferrum TaxID=3090833 RepID=A0ABU5WK61_9BURK|nr:MULTISPECIES: histidine phosphatase family protein [Burkholderia]MEB2503431.1 histidine phosphatase family protein [Burkholderia anthinoferrum]MEB2533927.1 histidine phosphatase family protein [Burkholderia anthinoferrum]MEB2565324.1 histidine phosphatase family protein [Burkholderia anthinoferrum]MEB2579385.1 histidine phosphatase family protein [Burkholderia anthinoferrum]KVH07731.1 phosphoglycerate mutase [Burkholderia anthina]